MLGSLGQKFSCILKLSAAPRATHSTRCYFAAAVLCAAALPAMAVDLPFARLCLADGLPGDLRRVLTWSEAFAHGLGVALIAAAALILDAHNRRFWPRILCTAYGAGLLANGVKLLVARTRPRHFVSAAQDLGTTARDTFAGFLTNARLENVGDHSLQSFPSAHTATAVGFAVGLCAIYPRARWLFVTLAVLSAAQRLEAGAHYLSDILVGAALGILAAGLTHGPGILGRRLDRLESAPRGGAPGHC